MPATPDRKWWKRAIIYQAYPRSFQDSNGDGIGDIPGIIDRLDYIASLGVDTVWINPIYTSPGVDNGYDISDYKTIQPEYGTIDDLQRLIDRLHEKKMRLIMDMVVNHTSAEHEWFRQARAGRDNPYYSFYHWWPEEKGRPPYRCGFFDDAGQGWTWNEATRSWYLHYFSPEQPDLNWENPALRREIYSLLCWWLDKRLDGFRLDAITFISKDTTFPEITPQLLKEKYLDDWGHYYAGGPHLHEYLQEMHREVWSKYNAVTIGEAPGIRADEAPFFVAEERKELDMLCHFEGIMIGYLPGEFKKMAPGGYSLHEWKDIYTRWDAAFDGKGWGTVYLGNHDQPRMLSHFGDDSEPLRQASAKMLFTFLLTMRATPFIYNGDEIGMTNIRFTGIEDYEDIETHRLYRKLRDSGGDAEGFLKDQQLAARDNGRTPFQWNGEPGAGFTTGRPWLKINSNHVVINRDRQEKDPDSILNYVRRLIRLRKAYPALIEGRYELLSPDNPAVYAYTRSRDGLTFLVLLNFTRDAVDFDFPLSAPVGKEVVINNYSGIEGTDRGLRLHPYQAVVFACGH